MTKKITATINLTTGEIREVGEESGNVVTIKTTREDLDRIRTAVGDVLS